MKERQPWNIEETGRTLRTEPVQFEDEYGIHNYRFDLKLKDVADPQLEGRLVLTPESLSARFRNSLYEVIIPNISSISPDQDYLRIISTTDNVQRRLFINPNGSIIFTLAAVERRLAEDNPKQAPEEEVTQETTPTIQEINEQPTVEVGIQEQPNAEEKKSERVTLTGRVGRLLEPKEYGNGSVSFKLPLAVRNGDEGKPTWFNIYLYNERAKKAAEIVHTGQIVTVVAYKHEGALETKTGIKRDKYVGAVVRIPKQST